MRKIHLLRGCAGVCLATAILTACVASDNVESMATPSSAIKSDMTADSITDAINSLNIDKPEDFGMIKLAEYKKLVVTVPVMREVTDDDVEARIKDDMSDMSEDAEEITDGYFTNINFIGKIDGEEFDGGSADNYTLEIGSHSFIDGFEEALIGLKVGDVKDVQVTFPDDYYSDELAGKNAIFTVTVNSISKIPDLTDDIAHQLNDSCDTADEYREYVKNQITEELEFDYLLEKGSRTLSDIKELSEVSVTDEAIDWASNLLIKQYYVPTFAHYYGSSFAEMLVQKGTTLDAFKDSMYDQAKQMAEDTLVVDAIAKNEGIEITDEVRQGYAANFGLTVDELIQEFGAEYVDFNVMQYEVYKVLNDSVVYTYVTEE